MLDEPEDERAEGQDDMKATRTSAGQRTLFGTIETATVKPRAGAIGKVERMLDERPWLTCAEIGEAIGEPGWRVSECLNKLKHEGAAQWLDKAGTRGRRLWASTSKATAEQRDAAIPERLQAVSDVRAEDEIRKSTERLTRLLNRAGIAPGSVDA